MAFNKHEVFEDLVGCHNVNIIELYINIFNKNERKLLLFTVYIKSTIDTFVNKIKCKSLLLKL